MPDELPPFKKCIANNEKVPSLVNIHLTSTDWGTESSDGEDDLNCQAGPHC